MYRRWVIFQDETLQVQTGVFLDRDNTYLKWNASTVYSLLSISNPISMISCATNGMIYNYRWTRTLSMATALCKLQLELKCSSSIEDFQSRTPPIREHNKRNMCKLSDYSFFLRETDYSACRKSEQLAYSILLFSIAPFQTF